jgi:acetylglutamate synthase
MSSIILYSKVSNKILSRSIPAFKNLYTTLGNTAVKVKEVDDNDSVDLKYHDLDLNNTNNNNQERELIYQILSTVPSKREAQHFLDTYADSFPQSFNNSILLSNNKRERSGKADKILNPTTKENIGLVKIPSLLTDEELKTIGSTIVQLQHLGLMPIIFVDWPLNYKDNNEYRMKMINETIRISNIIEEMGGRSMPLYNNIFSTDKKEDVAYLEKNIFSHKKNIIDKSDYVSNTLNVNMTPIRSALKLHQVPILIPIVSCNSQFFSTDFDRSMISFSKALTEDDLLGNPMKIIVLNNNGGICANGYHYGFINLANEYEELLNSLDEEIKKWKAEIKSKNKLHNKFANINGRISGINSIKKGTYTRFNPSQSSPIVNSKSLTTHSSTSSNSPYHLSKPSTVNLFNRATPNSNSIHSNFSTSLFPHSRLILDTKTPKSINQNKKEDSGIAGSTDKEMKNVLNIGLLRKYQMLYELQTMKIILSNLPVNTSAIIASISSTPSIISNLITDKPICSDNILLQKQENELQPFLQYPPTLIRQGLKITRHTSLDTIDREKLLNLLNTSFKKPIDTEHYFKRLEKVLDSITITGDYQGASIITREGKNLFSEGKGVPYLDKFAVSPNSQGIGVADILWKRMKHDYPNMLWRSRAENPVNNWYFERSSGSIFVPTEHQDWRLFFYGESKHYINNYCEIIKNIPASFKQK